MIELVANLFKSTHVFKPELFMQLQRCHIGGDDEREQGMHLVIGAGRIHQGGKQRGAYALALSSGGEIDGGLITARPHLRIAVRMVERLPQVGARIGLRDEARAALFPDVAQVGLALCDVSRGSAENNIGVLDGPVEGLGHRGHVRKASRSDQHGSQYYNCLHG